jgi:cell division septum initiation protein DivIVA
MKRDYYASYPTSSKSAEGKPTERSIQAELKKVLSEYFCLSLEVARQHQIIDDARQRIADLKETVRKLRDKNDKLQQQVDSYATYSDDSRARISIIQYRQMLGEERNNKNYFIHRLKKEIEKTTELAQAVTNLKRRNKSLLGNFKALNNVNHDDLELAIGLFAELVKQVSIIMDRNKPDTSLEYKKTLDEVVRTINQQASIINEIYTVIQNSKNRKD